MLSAPQQKAYQEFLVLLTKFKENFKDDAQKINPTTTKERFRKIQQWFEEKIAHSSAEHLAEVEIAPSWQAIQRELIREFRLLSTDVIFLASARQTATKKARLQSIDTRIDKLINYCQTMISQEKL
ncbi:heterocyst frequency control protein PatD [Myxosarcina sp. GI1]|uniref:heterocyst frequency control protein PatD n=1 Tax=Myxosarcina sp. GI1 TaxID=1541065 RepID=UPI00056977CC|nr:heterocyst frequency control protein PatD [Myxosarcina sp. GI1]